METNLFTFELPFDRIAQTPAFPRDSSKLLLYQSNSYRDHLFSEIVDLLTPGDFLVLNDAKVLPVRLLGHRVNEKRSAGGVVEALLLKPLGGNEWGALLHISTKVKPGLKLLFEPGLNAEVLSTHDERIASQGEVRLRFSGMVLDHMPFEKWLERHGHVPLPPYIERQANLDDHLNYQTVYASKEGSAAAPTAGFHFTKALLEKLQNKGVEIGYVTLHVGLGTFRPIKASNLEEHVMHEETYEISSQFAQQYQEARQKKKRLVAVGSTVVRALESWIANASQGRNDLMLENIPTGVFKTSIFIRPGYQFKAVDDLITNFHLPKSTLLVLVAALMGIEPMQEAYRHALAQNYRFFSYGDAMFIRRC